jgi:Cof subfamily protein (haloacid dehalogenase superfamily)
MIRLVLMDVDGTLVGASGPHPSTWPALEEARARGMRLGLCTGRFGRGLAEEYAVRVDAEGLHVFQNGAVISRPGAPATHKTPLDHSTFLALVAISRREGEPLEAYGERRFFVERHTDLIRVHERALGIAAEIADLTALEEPVVRAQWVVSDADFPRFRDLTLRVPGVHVHPARAPWSPGTVFSNLTHPEATKASALRWVAAHYGFAPAEVAMVGDAENDLEAMAAAGFAIAMGNAPEPVRARAQAVVSDVDAGGLAEAIRLALRR